MAHNPSFCILKLAIAVLSRDLLSRLCFGKSTGPSCCTAKKPCRPWTHEEPVQIVYTRVTSFSCLSSIVILAAFILIALWRAGVALVERNPLCADVVAQEAGLIT